MPMRKRDWEMMQAIHDDLVRAWAEAVRIVAWDVHGTERWTMTLAILAATELTGF